MDKPSIAQLVAGLNLDSTSSQVKEGQYVYALNAVVENFDGNSYTLQNEQGNDLCFTFPEGYKVIGVRNIIQLNKTIVFLTNTTTGDSEVGFAFNDTCLYETQISDVGNDCKFGFNINYPIHKIIIKSDNCSTQAYFTDELNSLRYIDFDDLPWKEIIDPTNSFKRIKLVGQLDCNKLNVQPDFSIPEILGQEVTIGGSLISGTYQGIIQYSNALGEGLTSLYNSTNPISIFEQRESADFNLPTAKAITFKISNLDLTGLYEYFNLVVIKTINEIITVEVVGTFPISDSTYTYTYTGTTKTDRTINIEDVFLKFPHYDTAGDIFEVDNVLGWAILRQIEEANLQPLWNKLELYWESFKLPYNQFQAYNNGVNSEKYKGYMRDEIYALEGCLIYTNGVQGRSHHVPARLLTDYDLELISVDNLDNGFSTLNPCEDPLSKPRWQVYNTANILHTEDTVGDCYIGPYQYGQFAGWQSTELYPNNTLIWGDLANTPIRHHKFPDVLVSPIHDNNTNNDPSFEHSIFPIGIRIDASLFIEALKSTLSPQQLSQVAGFKITRGDRAINKSIIAKGLIHNVGTTIYDSKSYYYPNYPFNDLRPDPYYTTVKLANHVDFDTDNILSGFTDDSKSHFTFHSPDTHFYQPSIDNAGEFLKLETIEYGKAKGHFVKVDDNAEYKFLTPRTVSAAAGLGIASGVVIGAGTFGSPEYNMSAGIPTYTATIDLFERLSPYTNFAYNFNSVGNYSNSYGIPNEGFKQRGIKFNKYVIDGLNGVEEGKILNNFRRESAIYIATNTPVKYPNEYAPFISPDNSRFNLASIGDNLAPEIDRESSICSYYGSIKREVVNQWGHMYSYDTIDTGFYQSIRDGDGYITEYPTIFGGDIFINRFAYKSKLPFFRDNTVAAPNQTDIAYDEIGNLNYPIFWISTKAQSYDINVDNEIQHVLDEFVHPSFFAIIANIVGGGARGSERAMALITKIFSEIHDKLGRKNVNMDRGQDNKLFEEGLFYLFAYGIPYFFVESEVNVDYRQATNQREGDFYPNVGGDIPDDWLQEKSVPIIQDNKYTYNKTYSKQNKENFFAHLREDYDPTKLCNTDFPNRAFWSEPANVEETKNNWLVYKPSSRFDFPKSFGSLTAIDGIENKQVIARFENKTLLYNVLYTAPTSAGQVYLGKPLFDTSSPPLDYADTDLGYVGSQHKMFLKTEMGHIQTDSKRGQVFLMQGQKAIDLTESNVTKFFTEFLSFAIQEAFPDFNVDNIFNGCGLTGVYDPKYDRFILTKIDYKPTKDNLILDNGKFYIEKDQSVISLIKGGCCPEGWTLDGDICTRENKTLATKNTDVVFIATPINDTLYSKNGTRIYSSYNPDGSGVFTTIPTTSHFWTNISGSEGPMNRLAFWNNSMDHSPFNVFVYVTFQINITEEKQYYLGIAGDNIYGLDIDCEEVLLVSSGADFQTWNVFPISLSVGTHLLKMKVNNLSGPGAFAVEIYDNTSDELVAATSLGDLNVVFSTADLFGQTVEGFNYSCPDGCNTTILEGGSYFCISFDNIPKNCIPDTTSISTIKVRQEIELGDPNYFCNYSFTISYNFKTNAWTSFHSYIPNYYIGNSNFFFTGDNKLSSAWRHNTSISKFNNFFGILEPYIIEYPIYFKGTDEILQNIKDYSKILKYFEFQEFIETDDVYFNKAIISNSQQCSGTLLLTKKPKNSLSTYSKYPQYNLDSKEVLYTKSNSFYQFNTFWALQRSSQQPMWKKSCQSLSIYKELNDDNMNYSKRSFNKAPLMSKDTRIRLINDATDQYLFVSQFIIAPSMTSYK